ncbi:hypothetical protein P43SY_001445 [Pythium insidiosum]|uniref:Protein kinase domain-containing protein n=1 Tax=Pythium insidiosum TaxID=114742 RepID=A0AAD5LQT3_PYTIN|nr:hypothetical protein P43SY_001445 [Pythium insidiosum]
MGMSRYECVASLRPAIFGEILLCRDTQTREEVVVKTIDMAMASQQQSKQFGPVKENALQEIQVLSRLGSVGGHPNVINMRNYYLTTGNILHVVMDYCEGGDLLESCATSMPAPASSSSVESPLNVTHKSSSLNEKAALGFLSDVVSGLQFLHSNGIAHRDISLENILVRDGRAVIADFGLSITKNDSEGETTAAFQCDDVVGKNYYMAPEVVAQAMYDPTKADIWSVGITFFILLTSSPPFEMATPEDTGFRYVAKHGLKAVFKAWDLGDAISEATQDLLQRMTAIDPANRPSIDEILSHRAFADINPQPDDV